MHSQSVLSSARKGYQVVVCLALLGLAAASLPAQVGDLLDKLLGSDRGGRIDSVEATASGAGNAVLRVTYSGIENPGGVEVTARFLDIRLRSLDGFVVAPAVVDDAAGVVEIAVVYQGESTVTTSSVEVKLEKDGTALARKTAALVRPWSVDASGFSDIADSISGGGSEDTPSGGGSPTPAPAAEITEVVIDPIPLPGTPTGSEPPSGGGGSGTGGTSASTPSSPGGPSITQPGSAPAINPGIVTTTIQPRILTAVFLPQLGYLWANQQTANNYQPPPTYAYNSGGGGISVARASVGAYGIQFEKLAANSQKAGSLLVTSYGADATRCQVQSWNSHARGFQGSLRCSDGLGRPADSQFTTLTAHALGGSRVGYITVDSPATAEHALDGRYVANAGGSAVSVKRNGTGSFSVTFPGLATGGNRGNVQVTGKGTGGEYCKLGGWSLTGDTLVANVRCFSGSGAAADSGFSLLAVVAGDGAKDLAYGLTNVPGNASHSVNPSLAHAPSAVRLQRAQPGSYEVQFPGMGGTRGGTVQVTAVGLDSNWCKVRNWSAEGDSFSARVMCFRGAEAADSAFSILVVR